jgi:hypothetical protein
VQQVDGQQMLHPNAPWTVHECTVWITAVGSSRGWVVELASVCSCQRLPGHSHCDWMSTLVHAYSIRSRDPCCCSCHSCFVWHCFCLTSAALLLPLLRRTVLHLCCCCQQIGWATIHCPFTAEEGVGDAPDSYAVDGKRLRSAGAAGACSHTSMGCLQGWQGRAFKQV